MICKISKYEWIFSIISRIIHNLQFFLSKKKNTKKNRYKIIEYTPF